LQLRDGRWPALELQDERRGLHRHAEMLRGLVDGGHDVQGRRRVRRRIGEVVHEVVVDQQHLAFAVDVHLQLPIEHGHAFVALAKENVMDAADRRLRDVRDFDIFDIECSEPELDLVLLDEALRDREGLFRALLRQIAAAALQRSGHASIRIDFVCEREFGTDVQRAKRSFLRLRDRGRQLLA
jgi:hypothetical protein